MKKRNLLLASSIFPAIMALAGISAACQKKFDQVNDGKLVINYGFSSTGAQGRALEEIVAKYNEWIKKPENQGKGYMPVETKTNPNGYSTNDLGTKLHAKERRTFYNLMFNYPTAAAIIAEYDMNLRFKDEDYESYGLSSAFKDVNKYIAYNKNNEKWVVPVSRSSEMNAVNQVVIGKLLKALKDDYSVKFKEGNKTLLEKYVKNYESSADKTTVDSIWDRSKLEDGEAKNKLKEELKDYEISDDVFTNYVDLIKLSNYMKRAFPKDKSLYVLGLDSVPNAVYAMARSIAKGDLAKELVTPDEAYVGTGGYDYSSFHRNPDSPQYKLFKKLIDYILEGINTGAVWIGGGWRYGSGSLTKHKLGFSVGSTAGYYHTFEKDGSKTVTQYNVTGLSEGINLPDGSLKIAKNGNSSAIMQYKSGTFTNSIFPSTYTGTVGRHNKQTVDSNADSLIREYADKEDAFIVSDPANLKVSGSDVKIKNGSTEITIPGAKALGKIFKNDNKDYYFIPKESTKSATIGEEQVANKKDVDWISAPLKANNSGDEISAITPQGPSIVGIHANEAENEAARKFVNWFFKEKVEYTFGSEKKTVTSLEMFNEKGSYLTPTNEFLQKDAKNLKLNEAQKLAFENFKKANSDNANYKIVEDVSSKLSELLRSNIQSALTSMTSLVANSGEIVDFTKFLNLFNGQFNEQVA
ncbi:P68 family surface lipoprotein [Metamycoplasma arthritidis]|uniref:Hypothetical lipoprotein n=1 Tax=Metamycoplasma arthritidis (strain 158L3-1) TaxID=243272 RepID=B3PNF6_META1|nr:P80 family lipoprotein [Metamycoplasma arthritidis]ACF07558.1 hypothetical lipoprotein [Metamycoplasma arthritidis 158L3-1]